MIFISGAAFGIAAGILAGNLPGAKKSKPMWITLAVVVSLVVGGLAG